MLSSRMQHEEFEVPEALRDIIKCFWYTRIDFEGTFTDFEVMPDGHTEIVFHFGSPCRILLNGTWQPLPSPFIMGLLSRPAILNTNRLEVLGVRCHPWAIFDLLGLPSGNDGMRPLDHPVSSLQAGLHDCLRSGCIREALDLLKQYFLGERSKISTDPTLFKAGSAIRETNGTMPVSQVAETAHATIRTLERKFKASSGHTVKDISGLVRFEQARNHLWLHPEANLAALAHDLGYTDQPHLCRDFKRYSGLTPAAFARKAKKG